MALKPCKECGTLVSTEAKQCPHCGIPRPVARRLGSGPVGIAFGALVLVIIVGGLLSSDDDAGGNQATDKSPAKTESQQERNARDSIRLRELLAASALTEEDVLETDSLMHSSAHPSAHDSIHARAVRLHLDSAALHLKPNSDGYGATALAQPHLSAIYPPLSAAQETRLHSLKSRLVAQNARIRVVANKVAAQFLVKQRKDFAAKLENEYLDKGLDITVSALGPEATTLKLKWILVNRVLAHQFSQNGEMFTNLRNTGFKKLIITDGFDQTWYWNL